MNYARRARGMKSRNSFRPNNAQDNQEKEKREYLRQKKAIEHKKVMDIINTGFNKNVKHFVTFNDVLSIRIRNNRAFVSLYWYRFFPDKTDWLQNPQKCIDKMASICPLFKRLSVWISSQAAYGKNNQFVKCDFLWTNNKYDIEESGMDSFESMFIAIKLFKQEMDRLRIEESTAYDAVLGHDFAVCRSHRYWNCEDGHKYIMNDGYITPEFAKSRDPNKDTTANLVKTSIKNKYPDANVQVSRLGSIRGKFVPHKLLILSSHEIDEEWLNKYCRRVNGQRVSWEKFQNEKNREERKEQTNEQRLREFQKQKIQVGKHKDVEYMETGKNNKKANKKKISADDYSEHMKYWQYGESAFTSTALKKKMGEIYGGVDGNAWITDKMVQSDSKFISFSKKVLGIIQAEEKEADANDMEQDEEDDSHSAADLNHNQNQNHLRTENNNNIYNGNNNNNNNLNGFTFNIQTNNDNNDKGGLSQFKF